VRKNHYNYDEISTLLQKINAIREEIKKLYTYTDKTKRADLKDLLLFTDE